MIWVLFPPVFWYSLGRKSLFNEVWMLQLRKWMHFKAFSWTSEKLTLNYFHQRFVKHSISSLMPKKAELEHISMTWSTELTQSSRSKQVGAGGLNSWWSGQPRWLQDKSFAPLCLLALLASLIFQIITNISHKCPNNRSWCLSSAAPVEIGLSINHLPWN